MKLEAQVITKDQAKRLKGLSINAEAIWYWVYTKRDGLISTQAGVCHKEWAKEIIGDNEGNEFDHEMAAAYGVAELGIMLPACYDTMYCTAEGWYGYDHDGNDFVNKPYITEAECRAAMLIALLESKAITAEDCNKRLLEA